MEMTTVAGTGGTMGTMKNQQLNLNPKLNQRMMYLITHHTLEEVLMYVEYFHLKCRYVSLVKLI